MSVIAVKLPDTEYGVFVRRRAIDDVGSILSEHSSPRKIIIVTDANVAPVYATRMARALETSGFEPTLAIMQGGEQHKTLATLQLLYDQVLPTRPERSTPVIGLGGGIVTDVAGFLAASLLRGVPYIPMPTTLLAMVDASVGGKTGVNHAAGKNLIGAFHQPRAVVIDPSVLTTLPPREFRAGLAECIKHEIIRDGRGFDRLERELDAVLALDPDALDRLIVHNVSIKASVVQEDPFEHNVRAHLNFGHTFGHAIEKATDYSFLHGECVALGMVAATRAAGALKMISSAEAKRIEDLIGRAGLPTSGVTISTDSILDAMRSDKKVRSGKLRLILPDRIGGVVIRDDVDLSVITQAIESIR
jgi:3-dehydroquinate synthase